MKQAEQRLKFLIMLQGIKSQKLLYDAQSEELNKKMSHSLDEAANLKLTCKSFDELAAVLEEALSDNNYNLNELKQNKENMMI